MKETNFLLLDLNSSGDMCNTLGGILASVPRWVVQTQRRFLADEGPAAVEQQLISLIRNRNPDVIFLVMPPSFLKQGPRLIQCLQAAPAPPLIIALETGEPDEISALLELGAADFIIPPLTALDVLPRVRRLLERTHRRRTPPRELREQLGLKQFIGEHEIFCATVKKLPLIARCDVTVLLSGETGTGKELCARAIHYLSPRAPRAFITVNCGAIPAELVENELFGHERGAFTTAVGAQAGLVGEADGGTLFLDEIDSLTQLAQVKLLRFLQEKEYRPLGSVKTRRTDVRVIAAANVDFDEAVRAGKLRHDLYYRLNVVPLRLPPLRERSSDIPLLARHFLAKYLAEFDRPKKTFSPDAMNLLLHYEWPGNVRELENLIARTVALTECDVIEDNDLGIPRGPVAACPTSFSAAKAHFERAYVENLLLTHLGNITRAAQAAHKNRRAFWELIRKHHIDVDSFKAGLKTQPATK